MSEALHPTSTKALSGEIVFLGDVIKVEDGRIIRRATQADIDPSMKAPRNYMGIPMCPWPEIFSSGMGMRPCLPVQ